ncbi:MAG: glycerol-3-phosphate acyltransferase [Ruminococcus sp.]|nr:glycerol-3-phosphate acyltransferase [Ruminococcus sp.]
MMSNIFCIIMGYFIGTLSPAALFSKIKKKNLKHHGTGNLGATNTMLVLGKRYGALVMVFDIAKSFAAVKLAEKFFPALSLAGLLAGSTSVVGHIFPFYLKFKGGKGLASYGGMVLALDPLLFAVLLFIGCALMFIVNYGVVLPLSAAVLFPIINGIRSNSIGVFLIAFLLFPLLVISHRSNLLRIRQGEEIKIRDYLKSHLTKSEPVE